MCPADADLRIRPATAADAGSLASIYNFYVRETIVTFEETELSETEMASRLQEVQAASLPWVVAERAARVLGYAYAGRWKPRHGYRFSTEVTVYLDREFPGQGIGSRLYADLLARLPPRGVHLAIGGIALPNAASVALHEKFGFEKVAHFREVGSKFGRWIDVAYWQKVL